VGRSLDHTQLCLMNNKIVVRRRSDFTWTWVCEDCGQGGMGLGYPGPAESNLRYAREKHVCRYVKSRECGP